MKPNEAMGELNDLISPLAPEVTSVRSEPEVRVVSELDALVYGGESIDHEGLCSWWRAYPAGIYVLWIDSKIVGALGVWPIKKATYNKIIKGEIDEVDITGRDISRRAAGRTHSYWYVADIVLEKRYRNKPEKWALFLLEAAISKWLREGNLASEIHLCALGFEREGISLLENFKFSPAGDNAVRSPADKPVYQRTVKIKDIQQVLDHLTALRRGEKEYDVFISYRRERTAKIFAQLIQSELENRKLKVCLDVTDFRQGPFPKTIQKNIVNSPHFILILSRGCFVKRSDEEDYFREEIALAIRKKRNIIPIMLEEFEFPRKSTLTTDIRVIRDLQSVLYTHDYSDAMIEKIIGYMQA
jgi:hypothetical protein